MKLTVIIVAVLLLACMAAGMAVAQKASPEDVLKDLDSLTLQADELSNNVRSELVDLNIAAGSLNNTSVSSVSQPGSIMSVADRGAIEADAFEEQLSAIEKGLWTIQSRYDSGQYSNKDATAIESRMSYLENRVGHIRNMITDMRIAVDRIKRAE